MAACRNLCMMMSRVKASPLPPLVAKAAAKTAAKDRMSAKALYGLAVISTASAYAVLVVAKHVGPQFPICLTIGLATSFLSGLCLVEFVTSHSHGGQSVYSCVYQSISEICAYVVGWTSILSCSAVVAAISIEAGALVDAATNHQVSSFIKSNVSPSCPDVLPLGMVVLVAAFSVAGMSYASWWVVPTTILAFLCTAAIAAGMPVIVDKSEWLPVEQLYDNLQLSQILSGTALTISAFLGSQHILRFPSVFGYREAVRAVVPLNILFYLGSLICGTVLLLTKFFSRIDEVQHLDVSTYALAVLPIVPICLLAIEYYNPLMAVVQDMSADGLVFRSLAKRWKSCCQRVPTLWTFFLTAAMTGVMTTVLSLDSVLKVTAVTPLLTNCVVAIKILRERYQDSDYWQYEPMLQNGSAPHHRSRKRSTEFLPRNDLSRPISAFQVTDNSDSEGSSETDIDSVVQDYKESVKLAGLTTLERSGGVVQEPTPQTSSRARILVLVYTANCFVLTVSFTAMVRTGMPYNIPLLVFMGLTALMSLVVLLLLRRFPQSWSSAKCRRISSYFVPWIPGLAFVSSLQFLVYVVIDIWHVLLGWTILGLLLYLLYGMRNSTAATSFYGMPGTAQLSLQPFPFLKESNVRQVILPERKHRSKRKI